MPCNSDGYSEPRGMDPGEAWKSFSRHHKALEIETEHWRLFGEAVKKKLADLKKLFPGVSLKDIPPMPKKTPDWQGITYRDSKGRFPRDITKHLDWLSDEDFK